MRYMLLIMNERKRNEKIEINRIRHFCEINVLISKMIQVDPG